MYANYFYDTSVIFSNSIITYREPFTICIGHDQRTDVIGIDWHTCVEQRTIFRHVTIFRHIFLIPCNFFIFSQKQISFFHANSLKEMVKICFSTLKNHYVKMWRNMVPLAKYGFLLYKAASLRTTMDKKYSDSF